MTRILVKLIRQYRTNKPKTNKSDIYIYEIWLIGTFNFKQIGHEIYFENKFFHISKIYHVAIGVYLRELCWKRF